MSGNEKATAVTPDALYRGWSVAALQAEAATYKNTDPDAWLNIAVSLCRLEDPGGIKAKVAVMNAEPIAIYEPSGSNVLALRLIRYLAIENFFLLLLSGQGSYPYARIATLLRHNKLNASIKCVSRRQVPVDIYPAHESTFSYEQWLLLKLGSTTENVLCETLDAFIVEQANFIDDRTFFNAIKHGRAMTGFHAAAGLVIDGSGSFPRKEQRSIWVEDWSELRNGTSLEVKHSISVETLNVVEEFRVLSIISLLVRNIINVRSAIIEMKVSGSPSVSLESSLPCDIQPPSEFIRIKGLPTGPK